MDSILILGWEEIALRLGKPLEKFLRRKFPNLSDHERDDLPRNP